jgi:hypothetical protein
MNRPTRTVTRAEKEEVDYLLFVGYTLSNRLEQVVANAVKLMTRCTWLLYSG